MGEGSNYHWKYVRTEVVGNLPELSTSDSETALAHLQSVFIEFWLASQQTSFSKRYEFVLFEVTNKLNLYLSAM